MRSRWRLKEERKKEEGNYALERLSGRLMLEQVSRQATTESYTYVTERDDALIATTLSKCKFDVILSGSFLHSKLVENGDLQERWFF